MADDAYKETHAYKHNFYAYKHKKQQKYQFTIEF